MYKKVNRVIEHFETHTTLSDDLTYLDIEYLKKGQRIMTNMFKQFDKMCRENNIQYWCISGTLLGVIRHKGWIPYDGDIDVCMMEEDYQKFKTLTLNDDMFIQDFETDPLYKKHGHEYLAKIRHKHSCYITTRHNKFHHGLQLDIFIMKKEGNNIVTPEKWSSQINADINSIFPLKEGQFEELKVYIPNNPELLLTNEYGSNYMTLLDVEDRYPAEGLIDPNQSCASDRLKYKYLY